MCVNIVPHSNHMVSPGRQAIVWCCEILCNPVSCGASGNRNCCSDWQLHCLHEWGGTSEEKTQVDPDRMSWPWRERPIWHGIRSSASSHLLALTIRPRTQEEARWTQRGFSTVEKKRASLFPIVSSALFSLNESLSYYWTPHRPSTFSTKRWERTREGSLTNKLWK